MLFGRAGFVSKRKPMSESAPSMDLLPVLSSLVQWLKTQQVSYAIIGGLAVGFVAQPRLTEDIDAVMEKILKQR